jgi:predicted DNA-binding WGR domain protein
VSVAAETPFLKLLNGGLDRGGFETDDVLAAMLPLMREVLSVHETGMVAPLNGLQNVCVNGLGQLAFDATRAGLPRKNYDRISVLQAPHAHAVDITGESTHTLDLDAGSRLSRNLEVVERGQEITRLVYVSGYSSWEHSIGHHDELTDVFSLGMILASLACGLDFSDPADLDLFASCRQNLFGINARLNPVLASVIVQMTELNRHRRAQDLKSLISRLENYREQPVDFDTGFLRIKGFAESPITGKRRIIQSHLRDRLFEISRRNRLLYFKPTQQTLNLTVASVPLVLDYRNIRLEQLFVWHTELADTVTRGGPMPLGRYLRFEDAPYIPGVLDKIISEARSNRAEYGFSQLRMVLCFLHWHNLKESPEERIHSPLLLLPVQLSKKKGVRDSYILDPTTSVAEINPALRHYLKELYNLTLPESIDLRETTLDQFYELLRGQIQASEPGVTLNRIDKPKIELIHERARQRVDQYRRRMKIRPKARRGYGPVDYSYERENFRPLGLQLFLERVRPSPAPLRDIAGAPPAPRLPHIVDPQVAESEKVIETQREAFALRDSDSQNPYSWDFDLCSITLGNFNYRKMTLVHDYANLIDSNTTSQAFDTVFSLTPRPPEGPRNPQLDPKDQFLIIPCDATQASAIAKARTGASYIIQGPPGTGKSQTITNLIADYVARGKRVLFVCEKRAAIDIVYHRLRQQGLDELCCLIHDSQTDKKEFIQNLKQTYERFLGEANLQDDSEKTRLASIKAIDQHVGSLRRFSEAMTQAHAHAGVPLRTLLHRLVGLRASGSDVADLTPELEDQLPEYKLWLDHGELIARLAAALVDLDEDPCFAEHPLRWLGRGVLQAERPLETLRDLLDRAESLLDSVESALELSGLASELWDTLEEIQAILAFASRVRRLTDKRFLGLLDPAGETAKRFAALAQQLDSRSRDYGRAREKAAGWKDPLSPDDTENALSQARAFEGSIFRFFQPAFWRLRRVLRARYDFRRHAAEPSWVKILEALATEHQTFQAFSETRDQAAKEWSMDDPQAFVQWVSDLRASAELKHPSVRALARQFVDLPDTSALATTLADIHAEFIRLDETLNALLAEHTHFDFPQLAHTLQSLRAQGGILLELLPVLTELVDLPDQLARAVRHAPLPLTQFESAMARKSLNHVYRQDRALRRFEGRSLSQRIAQLDKLYRDLLGQNALCIRAGVRKRFLEHVRISSLPAAQLTQEQKIFKKNYSAGRRDLEHEFGKSMRYKSIRDLAAGNTGDVIQDLKPIWLMSPLSISDTLPLDTNLFDVVIFDEASQIPVEDAIPAVFRSNQVIVVGDEMQLPPTSFFAASRPDEDSVVVEEEGEKIEVDLDSDSFLTQAGLNLPSTLLAWHYRSRYEALISFSNAAFYSGNLFTIPDRQLAAPELQDLRVLAPEQGAANVDALLARSISFHLHENAVYEQRRNPAEAAYIAQLVRALLQRNTGLSIGIVAFSEAQQTEIEEALSRLGEEDEEFGNRLEAEYSREENDQFCGLIVKNLENVQGDERDIIILSICYGYDRSRRMLMNFGPINQRGGEKRLNVIFSRAKHHMAIVSSIRHHDITNEYNDGANSLRNFLQYAEALSKGDTTTARRVLENLNPLARKALGVETRADAVVQELATLLRARGHTVDLNVGQSRFRCDLAIRGPAEGGYQLGILVDTETHYANPDVFERYFTQPGILRAFGWRVTFVLTKDWYDDREAVLTRLERELSGAPAPEAEEPIEELSEPEKPPSDLASSPPPVLTEAPLPEAPPLKPVLAKNVRRFEFSGGGSNKFWEISQDGNSFTVRFGRIGTNGQSQTKTCAEEGKARAEAAKLIAEKLRKGYSERI